MQATRIRIHKSFWLGLIFFVFFCALLGVTFILPLAKFINLARSGREATAYVSDYRPTSKQARYGRYTEHNYIIRYDGFTITKNLHAPDLVGVTIPVLYLPTDPSVVSVGKPGDTVTQLFTQDSGGEGLSLFVLIVFSFGSVFGIWLCVSAVKRVPIQRPQ